MGCSVDEREYRGIPVAYLRGDVELTDCPSLKETLVSIADPATRCLILELSEVTYVDSTGIGSIFEVQRTLGERGGRLAIVCCNPPLERLLAQVGFDGALNVRRSLDEAAGSLSGCLAQHS